MSARRRLGYGAEPVAGHRRTVGIRLTGSWVVCLELAATDRPIGDALLIHEDAAIANLRFDVADKDGLLILHFISEERPGRAPSSRSIGSTASP